MRRLSLLLALSLVWTGCQDSSDEDASKTSAGSVATGNGVTTPGGGAGGSAPSDGASEASGDDESEMSAGRGAAPSPISTGPGGAVGGVAVGSGAGTAAGGVAGGGAGAIAGGLGGAVGAGTSVDSSGSFSAGGTSGEGGSGASSPPTGKPRPQSGQLTAGTWDDNLNYERFTEFREEFDAKQEPALLPFEAADFDAAHALFEDGSGAHARLDVAFVIDTTGSMGDEISYLQSEFISLSSAIEAAYPDAEQRWALVVYRDRGDAYVTRHYDFSDDPALFRSRLGEQGADGGGDFPEAPEAAFEAMNQLGWRSEAEVARLAFWVADAPHHAEQAQKLAQGIRTAQGQDIHVYPVASSGVDDLTELSMRSAAQLTGGRYLFLTDDSGIGGAHKEPSIPCYFVTLLRDAMLRMVEIEMSGEYREPEAADVIRAGGDPQDGACTLDSGEIVYIY